MSFKLLLVTDDIPLRQQVRGLAPALGADIRTAEQVESARQTIGDEHFQGIVVDASLRGLAREQFVWFVRRSKLNAPTPLYIVAGGRGPGDPKEPTTEGIWWVARTPGLPELRALLSALKQKVGTERRRHRRLPFRSSVNGTQGTRTFHATSINLGRTGMLLEVGQHFERRDEFELHFQLEADSPTLRVHARVVRKVGPSQFGVIFESMSPECQRLLTAFLSRHLPTAK